MKKLILGACALTCAASVFAQGTVIFNNRIAGTLITHVYMPDLTSPGTSFSGNGPTDIPAGTTTFTGAAVSGSGFTAQLWAAPGLNQPETALAAANPTTTFRTGGGAGFVAGTTATLSNVAADAPNATIALRVWDNQGGTITSWQQALTAGAVHGESPLFNVSAIGGTINPAPALTGLSSFSLVSVPEPTTFALAGLGAAALLIFRRRK